LFVEDDLAAPTIIEDLLGPLSETLFLLQTVKSLEIGSEYLAIHSENILLVMSFIFTRWVFTSNARSAIGVIDRAIIIFVNLLAITNNTLTLNIR